MLDPELVLIFSFALSVVLVVTFGVTKIVNRSLEHREWMENAKSRTKGPGEDAYAKLEERVRVLKRIATDKSDNGDLARQIEQLRDLQEIDDLTGNRENAR